MEKDERIYKYIPKRLRPYVESCFHDSDGYWIWFDEAVENTRNGSHTLHEDSVNDMKATLKLCVVKNDKEEQAAVSRVMSAIARRGKGVPKPKSAESLAKARAAVSPERRAEILRKARAEKAAKAAAKKA